MYINTPVRFKRSKSFDEKDELDKNLKRDFSKYKKKIVMNTDFLNSIFDDLYNNESKLDDEINENNPDLIIQQQYDSLLSSLDSKTRD